MIDSKQDEILHYIENHKLNASERCKIVGLLKDVRIERRQIKNEIDVIHSLKDSFIDKYKNKFIEKDIIIALKNLKELENRKNMTITGVSDVDSFDEQAVVAYTDLGELTVKGRNLHINKLSVETGELSLEGEIVSMSYTENQASSGGFLSKLFR